MDALNRKTPTVSFTAVSDLISVVVGAGMGACVRDIVVAYDTQGIVRLV